AGIGGDPESDRAGCRYAGPSRRGAVPADQPDAAARLFTPACDERLIMSNAEQTLETEIGREPPVLDVDPFTETILTDPYAFHERLRETAPVVRLAPYGIY